MNTSLSFENQTVELNGYGEKYNTLDEFFDYYAEDCTPTSSGYDTIDTIHFGETVNTLNDFKKLYKDHID